MHYGSLSMARGNPIGFFTGQPPLVPVGASILVPKLVSGVLKISGFKKGGKLVSSSKIYCQTIVYYYFSGAHYCIYLLTLVVWLSSSRLWSLNPLNLNALKKAKSFVCEMRKLLTSPTSTIDTFPMLIGSKILRCSLRWSKMIWTFRRSLRWSKRSDVQKWSVQLPTRWIPIIQKDSMFFAISLFCEKEVGKSLFGDFVKKKNNSFLRNKTKEKKNDSIYLQHFAIPTIGDIHNCFGLKALLEKCFFSLEALLQSGHLSLCLLWACGQADCFISLFQ